MSNEFFLSQNTPKSMSAGASPQTTLRELTAPPDPIWFQGGRFIAAAGEERRGEGRKGGMEKGGKGGKLGGIALWLLGELGDRHPCPQHDTFVIRSRL